LLSGFDVSLAEFEHAIEQAGEFVGSGVNGCGAPRRDLMRRMKAPMAEQVRRADVLPSRRSAAALRNDPQPGL
jgi:hypothetical protein